MLLLTETVPNDHLDVKICVLATAAAINGCLRLRCVEAVCTLSLSAKNSQAGRAKKLPTIDSKFEET